MIEALGAIDLERVASRWTCTGCGGAFVGLTRPEDRVCLECQAAASVEAPVDLGSQIEASSLPWRYRQGWNRPAWSKLFGAWPTEELSDWRARSDRCLLLIQGDPGTGKSGMAAILLVEALAEARIGSALWVRAQAFIDAQKASWEGQRANHPRAADFAVRALELERGCRSVDLVVLDDLFASRRATPYALERFQDVIADRFDEGRLTVVTTNRLQGELHAMLPSLESRLLSGVVVSPGDGHDVRKT